MAIDSEIDDIFEAMTRLWESIHSCKEKSEEKMKEWEKEKNQCCMRIADEQRKYEKLHENDKLSDREILGRLAWDVEQGIIMKVFEGIYTEDEVLYEGIYMITNLDEMENLKYIPIQIQKTARERWERLKVDLQWEHRHQRCISMLASGPRATEHWVLDREMALFAIDNSGERKRDCTDLLEMLRILPSYKW